LDKTWYNSGYYVRLYDRDFLELMEWHHPTRLCGHKYLSLFSSSYFIFFCSHFHRSSMLLHLYHPFYELLLNFIKQKGLRLFLPHYFLFLQIQIKCHAYSSKSPLLQMCLQFKRIQRHYKHPDIYLGWLGLSWVWVVAVRGGLGFNQVPPKIMPKYFQ